jgi:hypothetical protein
MSGFSVGLATCDGEGEEIVYGSQYEAAFDENFGDTLVLERDDVAGKGVAVDDVSKFPRQAEQRGLSLVPQRSSYCWSRYTDMTFAHLHGVGFVHRQDGDHRR